MTEDRSKRRFLSVIFTVLYCDWFDQIGLIKVKTQTAVINVVSFRIFINLTSCVLINIHFQKWSKVTVEDNDETIFTLSMEMRLRIQKSVTGMNSKAIPIKCLVSHRPVSCDGGSVGRAKKIMNIWRGLGSREGRAAK